MSLRFGFYDPDKLREQGRDNERKRVKHCVYNARLWFYNHASYAEPGVFVKVYDGVFTATEKLLALLDSDDCGCGH